MEVYHLESWYLKRLSTKERDISDVYQKKKFSIVLYICVCVTTRGVRGDIRSLWVPWTVLNYTVLIVLYYYSTTFLKLPIRPVYIDTYS